MFRIRVKLNQPSAAAVAFALCLVLLSIFLFTLSSAQAGPTSGVLDLRQADGLVRVEPAFTTVENGETFRIELWIYGAENLGGFQVTLNYDPNLIEVPKQTDPMILGDLIGSTGRTPMEVVNELDPVVGSISYAVITTGSSPGADGEGLLAFVELRARALGSSALDLEEVEVVDTGGRQQTISIGNGLVIIAATPDPSRASIDKAVDLGTVLPGGLLSYSLGRSLSLEGVHTFEEIVYDPIPGGTTYLDGSAMLNGIPAPELYSETLDAIYFYNSGILIDEDQWTIDFQVEVGVLPNGTVMANTVTETVRFDGASFTGPYNSTAESVVFNNPPNEPGSPSPTNGAMGVSTTADLSWTGGDPDAGQTVTYDVYFAAGDPTPNVLICDDVATPACDPGTLAYGTQYYWYVVATDGQGASTTGPTWNFTTGSEPNRPPYPPDDPMPEDGASDIPITADLSWTGGDPDLGDTVTYDIYFAAGDPTPETLICDDTSTPACDPGTLTSGMHYYWYVVATDSHSASTASPTWDFTTICPLPEAPYLLAPADGSTIQDTTPHFEWSPVDGASSYRIQVDDNGGFSSPELDATTSTPDYTPTSPLSLGTQYWHVRAVDPCGNSAWSQSWSVAIIARIYLPLVVRTVSN